MFKSDKFKQLVLNTGVSYGEMDRRLGTKNQFYKYANGKREPTPPTLARFLRALGWTDEQINAQTLADWYLLS